MRQPLIADRDKAQLKRIFRKDLTKEVTIRLVTQKPSPVTVPGRPSGRNCAETQQMMEELTALSPKVNLETIDFYQDAQAAREMGAERIPAIVLGAKGDFRAKFYGIPTGYGLATIVAGIKVISRGVSPLSMNTRKKLRQVNRPVHIQVFATPTDADCPRMAQLAHAFALDCQYITSDVVEIQEFPALGRTYEVRSVPTTVMNEHIRFAGPVSEPEFLEKALQAGAGTTMQTAKAGPA